MVQIRCRISLGFACSSRKLDPDWFGIDDDRHLTVFRLGNVFGSHLCPIHSTVPGTKLAM